ncbi:MAG: aminotransferase class IV [Thermodesulfobacteriota bacterium]
MAHIPVLDSDDYLGRLLALPRPGADKVLAFYEHRVGAVCKDVRLMLLPLDDHLLHRGDGVFESLKYVGRKLYQLDAHLERMQKSAAAISLAPPCSWEDLRDIALAVARAGGADNGMLRLLLGRGPGGFGIDPFESPAASLYVAAYHFSPKPDSVFEKGVTAFRSATPAKQSWLARIKSVNYLPNVLMKMEAVQKGYDYPFCFDEHGFLAEGATENVTLVDQAGTLVVPELTNSLPGTTLLRALDLIKGEVPVSFRGVTEADVYGAREVHILGTTGDCIPVVRYEGKPIHDVRPGPVARRLRELLVRDLEESGVRF